MIDAETAVGASLTAAPAARARASAGRERGWGSTQPEALQTSRRDDASPSRRSPEPLARAKRALAASWGWGRTPPRMQTNASKLREGEDALVSTTLEKSTRTVASPLPLRLCHPAPRRGAGRRTVRGVLECGRGVRGPRRGGQALGEYSGRIVRGARRLSRCDLERDRCRDNARRPGVLPCAQGGS